MQDFEKAAEFISQAYDLINLKVISSLREIHITDPSSDFIKKHRDIISYQERPCNEYPHEYSLSLNNVRFFWITRNLITEVSDDYNSQD